MKNYTMLNDSTFDKEKVYRDILGLGKYVAQHVNGKDAYNIAFITSSEEVQYAFRCVLEGALRVRNVSQVVFSENRIDIVSDAYICSFSGVDEHFIENTPEFDKDSEQYKFLNERYFKEREQKSKIICTNKFREHMRAHEGDFIVNYNALLQFAHSYGYLRFKEDDRIAMIIEFPFIVGYSTMCETDNSHAIVYAVRKNRSTYSKFILNGEAKATNKCIIVLNKSHNNENEYYAVTMYPGEILIKEPGDKSIRTIDERRQVDDFWKTHAFSFNHNDIIPETIRSGCKWFKISCSRID